MDRCAEAMAALDEGLAFSARTGIVWFDAELHGRKGELLFAGPDPDVLRAEQELQLAICIARAQSAKLFELRASTSLSRTWVYQCRSAEAWGLLQPVYNWFTEGIEMPDLRDAHELLLELRRAS
jgi:predicted ATPase